jgi:hypothetical protein
MRNLRTWGLRSLDPLCLTSSFLRRLVHQVGAEARPSVLMLIRKHLNVHLVTAMMH